MNIEGCYDVIRMYPWTNPTASEATLKGRLILRSGGILDQLVEDIDDTL